MSRTKEVGTVGSHFDDFLKQDGTYEDINSRAIKRVLALQLQEAMQAEGLTKVTMAKRLKTSRSQLDRILDPDNDGVTLSLLARTAKILGRSLHIELR
jgi:hypothetical protein